jgi:hypothetical protein
MLLFTPQVGMLQGLLYLDQGSGTANTSLVYHAVRLLALNEIDLPYKV